jgi:hypothetical protein
MQKMRVVGLSERASGAAELCVGLEISREAGEFRVEEVFEALQEYLELHRDELRQRGPEHVRVSMVRSVAPTGQGQWAARDECLATARPVMLNG